MQNPLAELQKQADGDSLLATQTNPAVIAQLQVWQMIKQTADWPPESILHMKQIAEAANFCLSRMCPSFAVEEVIFVQEEANEEDDEEEGI